MYIMFFITLYLLHVLVMLLVLEDIRLCWASDLCPTPSLPGNKHYYAKIFAVTLISGLVRLDINLRSYTHLVRFDGLTFCLITTILPGQSQRRSTCTIYLSFSLFF